MKIDVHKPYSKGYFAEREEDGTIISAGKPLRESIETAKSYVKKHPTEQILITKLVRIVEKLKKVI